MANTSFASGTLALASLKANGFKPRDTALRGDVADADLLLASQIAVFLCNKSQFDQQLRIVSEQMWKFYRALDPNEKNKFSRALSLVAEPFGFITSTRLAPDATRGVAMQLKLVGGDPELGYMLSRGLFWKDSMHNRHGEFTHSLQWLAIANKFGRGARTLYTRLGTYQAKTKDGKTAYLWQWLADCFPSDMRAEADAQGALHFRLPAHALQQAQLAGSRQGRQGRQQAHIAQALGRLDRQRRKEEGGRRVEEQHAARGHR